MDTEIIFLIDGMDCGEEIATLKRVLRPLVGEEDRLSFDLMQRKLIVNTSGTAIASAEIIHAVAQTGMSASPWEASRAEQTEQATRFWEPRVILTAASGLALALGFSLQVVGMGGFASALAGESAGDTSSVLVLARLIYALGICSGLAIVAPKAWYAARSMRPDMNLLMTIAVAGAVLIGEWFEASTVAFLFALSLLLESWSVGRARKAIAKLLDLGARTVWVENEDGTSIELDPEEVAVGTHFFVNPGQRVALDGRVLRGESEVDQAPITGESVPVPKTSGDEIYAGTINGSGALVVESTKPAADTVLAHIVRLISEAQTLRAPTERWVERFARIYTPAVLALAICVLLIPPLLFGAEFAEWGYRSLVLLVIACPCALVISTPVSIVSALASAARHGVLVKGGLYIEAPAHLRAIAFDKTGTLTEGKPKVVEIVAMNGHDERSVLERAAALEARSSHPLARAVLECANERGIAVAAASSVQSIPGRGATGKVNGKNFWIGSHRLLEERGQETAEVHDQLEDLSREGRSVVVIGNEEHVCGFLALADVVRPGALEVLQKLRREGVDALVMLTGDNWGTARSIARSTGVDEVYAELLPEDKVARIEQLVGRYGSVAMVGDGVNDAPAMASASLGIAMGAAGSDVAIETADIALMSDDLSRLPWLIRHGKRTLGIVRANIAIALAVKALFVVLTFSGGASLWSAIAADMGASFIVTMNGLRLLRSR